MKDDYRYGYTAGYTETQRHLTALVKSGRYGNAWRERLASDSELLVDASQALYQCSHCHRIFDEYSLDLYKSGQKHYAPSPEDAVYHFEHICPECKKKMECIPLYLNDNKTYNLEQPVICPKCVNSAVATFCGFID